MQRNLLILIIYLFYKTHPERDPEPCCWHRPSERPSRETVPLRSVRLPSSSTAADPRPRISRDIAWWCQTSAPCWLQVSSWCGSTLENSERQFTSTPDLLLKSLWCGSTLENSDRWVTVLKFSCPSFTMKIIGKIVWVPYKRILSTD